MVMDQGGRIRVFIGGVAQNFGAAFADQQRYFILEPMKTKRLLR